MNIEIDHVIVDELNLLLHEMDVMLDNIITEVIDWDKEDDFEKTCTRILRFFYKNTQKHITILLITKLKTSKITR